MKNKKYYTQQEVDEYVRKLLTDSEISLSRQSERIEKEVKENERLRKELEDCKAKEKTNARLLILSERKVKNMEQTARAKCAIELDRLARLADEWDDFFSHLENEYKQEDKEKLDEFKADLSKTIDGLLDMEDIFQTEGVTDAAQDHASEVNRLNVLRNKKKSELDDRFSKLVIEFNMKIGDNATRGRGRPKKQDSNNVKDIQKNLDSNKKGKTDYIPKADGVFDFEEALNPVDSLEDIMKDLLN